MRNSISLRIAITLVPMFASGCLVASEIEPRDCMPPSSGRLLDDECNTLNSALPADACNVYRCINHRCILSPLDRDGDGYISSRCGGNDCYDDDRMVIPRAVEQCGNLIDDNCDGKIDEGCGCSQAGQPCKDTNGVGACYRDGIFQCMKDALFCDTKYEIPTQPRDHVCDKSDGCLNATPDWNCDKKVDLFCGPATTSVCKFIATCPAVSMTSSPTQLNEACISLCRTINSYYSYSCFTSSSIKNGNFSCSESCGALFLSCVCKEGSGANPHCSESTGTIGLIHCL